MSNDHPNPKVTRLACHNRLFLILQLVVIQLLFPFGHAFAKIKRGHGRASLQELQLIPHHLNLASVIQEALDHVVVNHLRHPKLIVEVRFG